MDASIDFSGILRGSIADGVIITPVVTSGTKIADVTVNGVEKDLYTPTPFSGSYNDLTDKPTIPGIEFNPAVPATDEVETIDLNGTIYAVKDGDARAEINQINQSLSALVLDDITLSNQTTNSQGMIITNLNFDGRWVSAYVGGGRYASFRPSGRDKLVIRLINDNGEAVPNTTVNVTLYHLGPIIYSDKKAFIS